MNHYPPIRDEQTRIDGSEKQPRISLWRYWAATILPVLLLAAAISVLIMERFNDIVVAEDEIAGIEVVSRLNRAVTAVQKIRGLWQIRLQGGEMSVSSRRMIDGQQIEFESVIEDLIEGQDSVRFQLRDQLKTLHDDLREFAASPVGSYRAETLFKEQSRHVHRVLELMQTVAERSSLILDSRRKTHHLMELVVNRFPDVAEAIGRLRGVASGLAMKDTRTEADYVLLQGYYGSLERDTKKLLHCYYATLRAVPKTGEYPGWDVAEFVNSTLIFAQHTMNLFKAPEKNKNALQLFAEMTRLIDQNTILYNEAALQLRTFLEQRISSLRYLITYSILLTILVAVLVWFFVTGFYRSNNRMFNQLLFDIAGRKEAETELKKSEMRYRSTTKAALDGIVTIDEKGSIIEFNPAAEKIFGYRNAAIIGREVSELIIPADARERHRQGLKRYCETGQSSWVGKYVKQMALRADGTEFPVELTITPIQHRGEAFITAFIRDITERKEAEKERQQLQRQLQHSQKMEAIGQLTGGIAHDFNNMLAAILGYTELVREDTAPYHNESLEKYLDEIDKAGMRARDLIVQMLAFSRGGEAQYQPLILSPLIKDALQMLTSTMPSSIELEQRLDDDVPAVLTDSVQLQQLVMNLCINARDAMAGGKGYITVGLRRGVGMETLCHSCHSKVSGVFIELYVRDTGQGIEAEQLERIFDPFYTTKEVGKGTGMGLSMVHGIMHGCGGHIVVVSEPGKGSTFRLLFPVIEVQSSTVQKRDQDSQIPTHRRLNGRVLIVDDEPAVGGFMGDLLRRRGCSVTVETDSRVALSRLQSDPQAYDLVITDQTMPGLTGVELARALLELRPELLVVLCTGYSDQVDADKAKALGIRAYLSKPLQAQVLLVTVGTLLEQAGVLEPEQAPSRELLDEMANR